MGGGAAGNHGSTQQPLRSVLVLGAGLIGTSVGLALRARGVQVWLADADAARRDLAVALGAGEASPGVAAGDGSPVDLVVVAVPPAAVGEVLFSAQCQGLGLTYTDVASVKTSPLVDLESRGGDLSSYCGGHPVAGRERSGPTAARGDLFADRVWVVTPGEHSGQRAIHAVEALASACGARSIRMTPTAHDRVLARTSHVPQLVASALAALTAQLSGDEAQLVGPGLRDVLRIAGSAPGMWGEIVAANAAEVAAGLRAVLGSLEGVAATLESLQGAPDGPAAGQASSSAAGAAVIGAVRDLLTAGNEGLARLPGKHGGERVRFSTVAVVVHDRPGELARLLSAAAAGEINVEDIRVDHAPGQPVGVVELAVAPEQAARTAVTLAEQGWQVHRQEDQEV